MLGMIKFNNMLLCLSARIWEVHAKQKDSDSIEEEVVSSVLYGHNARVWDCSITDSVSFTKFLLIYWFFSFHMGTDRNALKKKIGRLV